MKMKMIHAKASMVVTVKARGVLLGVAAGVLGALAVRGDIDDPLAYWSFDDAENLLVNQVTPSPHHNASVLLGTPVAGVADGASGIVGNALLLDGTAAIRLPYHQDNLGTSFTLALWYWQQTNDTRQSVYQTRDNYTATYEAEAGAHSRFASYVGQHYAQAITTELREWVHLTHTFATVDGTTTLSVYTNGVFVFSHSVGSGAVFGGSEIRGIRGFHIGAARGDLVFGGWGWRCFKGMIDELALWGRALSAAEVEAVYQRGVSGAKLAFTPAPAPVISLGGKDLSFTLNTDSGLPAGMFNNGWLMHNVQDPAYPYVAADTAGTLFDYVPDTAGHASGPFHAEIADVKWRVPLTEALRQVPQGDFTLETWFRTTDGGRGTVMGNFYGQTLGVVNLEFFYDNQVRLYLGIPNYGDIDFKATATNVNTRNGQWHHLAGIRHGDTLYL
ncbi:MAG: LamG domain-containing protein [Kiritimatiellae bacterium]|nr:LamG domain-containing protein [Kiritimatiellia bacterium]